MGGLKTVTETAQAKINLALAVGALRPDGYHDLQTVMQTISLADSVEITLRPEAAGIECRCAGAGGREEPGLSGPDNIAVAAALRYEEELRRRTGRSLENGINIFIRKNIPVQAGLGGGSADAAAVLRGLNRLFGAPLSREDLLAAAARCGADVPFCLDGGTQWAEGTGTVLEALPPAPALPVLVAKPAAGVSTAEAYRCFDRDGRPARLDKEAWRGRLSRGEGIVSALANNLEPAVFALLPPARQVKSLLAEDCAGALLCGSGSAVFGLLPAAGERVARRVREELSCSAWAAVFTPGVLEKPYKI